MLFSTNKRIFSNTAAPENGDDDKTSRSRRSSRWSAATPLFSDVFELEERKKARSEVVAAVLVPTSERADETTATAKSIYWSKNVRFSFRPLCHF